MIDKLKDVISNKGFLRYAENASWLLVEKFLRILSVLFVGVWVARYLGPVKLGLFSYVMALAAILGTFSKVGLDSILLRELVIHPQKKDIYLGTAFWLKLFAAVIVVVAVGVVLQFSGVESLTGIYILVIVFGLLFQSFEVIEFYFQAEVLGKYVAVCKTVQLLFSSLLRIFLVLIEADLFYFVLAIFFDCVSLAICYFFAYKRRANKDFFVFFDISTAKELLKNSWVLMFSSIVVVIYMRLDQILLKEFCGDYELGVYSAALRLSESFNFIPLTLSAALFPAIVKAKNNEELFNLRLSKFYFFIFWIAIFIIIPIYFFSEEIISIVYGGNYSESAAVLRVNIWASLFVFIGVANFQWLLAENLQRIAAINTFIGAVISVSLNLLLMPKYGVLAASWVSLISYSISAYFSLLLWHETRKSFFAMSKSFLFWRSA